MSTDELTTEGIGGAQALAIAAAHLVAAEGAESCIDALKVVDGDADDYRRGATYGAPESFPSACWVVYIGRPPIMIKSSEIIGVRKSSGRVVYHGTAGDEG